MDDTVPIPEFHLALRRRKARQGEEFELDNPDDEYVVSCDQCESRMTVYEASGDVLGKGNASVVPIYSMDSEMVTRVDFYCSDACWEAERPSGLTRKPDEDE